jgi:hypothetical protein
MYMIKKHWSNLSIYLYDDEDDNDDGGVDDNNNDDDDGC